MTWLFPLYLLGAAAIIGPVLMHLRRRPPQDRVEFGSLMFLDAQTPVPVSKRRLEHWLLLLLRCLALILLALMFARPLWRGEETAAIGQGQATLVLLDRSASMRRADLWADAQAEAAKLVAAASATDRVALATFDRESQPVWTFTEDRESASTRAVTVKQRLQAVSPGWDATDLGLALVDAASAFGGEPGLAGMKKRVVVITDLQEGSRLDALRSRVWPETIAVQVLRLEAGAASADNLSLSLAATTLDDSTPDESGPVDEDLGKPASRSQVRVRLGNARDSKATDFTLAWEQGSAEIVGGYLPPGAGRVLPAPPVADAAQARVLRLTGDAWDFDNRVFVAPPQPKTVRIVFIGDETTRNEAASPLFYLSRALQTTPTILPELTVIPANAPDLPAGTHIVFISGAALKEPMVKALRAFTEAGGMAVMAMDDSTAPEIIEGLAGARVPAFKQTPAAASDYLMLAEVDTAHPLLRPFADERLRDFTKLRFWKHRLLVLDDESAKVLKVIARFDNRDPAILTASPGKGVFILLTSGWHPADSQLALSTKFVPLLYGWLEAAGFRNEQSASLLVGDVLPVEAGTTSIMTPDGQTLTPKPGQALRAATVGLYTLVTAGAPARDVSPQPALVPPNSSGDSASSSRLVAVNLPPEESRVTPMDPEKLREFGVRLETGEFEPGATAKAEDRERLATSEQEGRQRAWLWLLGGLLAILGWETWLAGRIRQSTPRPAYS